MQHKLVVISILALSLVACSSTPIAEPGGRTESQFEAPGSIEVDVARYLENETVGYHLVEEAVPNTPPSAPQPLHFDGHRVGTEFRWYYEGENYLRQGGKNHLAVYWAHVQAGNEERIGCIRDWASDTDVQRCFSEPGSTCTVPANLVHGPTGYPRRMTLPVVSGAAGLDATLARTSITPAAKPIGDWVRYQVNRIHHEDESCSQADMNPGHTLRARHFAFVVDHLDVGGDIHVIDNALVLEKEEGTVDAIGGGSYERYVFSPDHGLVFEEARANDACYGKPNPNPTACDGTYAGQPLSRSMRNRIVQGDLEPGFGAKCYQGGL